MKPNNTSQLNMIMDFCNIKTVKAQIVACGQRCIRSTKSGLTFPVFLVQFKDERCSGDCQVQYNYRYHWRSKKDFLLLNRGFLSSKVGLQIHQNSKSRVYRNINASFPKNVYSILCQEAIDNKPWIRPLNDNSDLSSQSHEILQFINEGNNGDDFDYVTEQDLITAVGYQAKMKKSLMKLDQFIQQYCNDDSSNNPKAEEHWKLFCRNEDCENIVNIKEDDDKSHNNVCLHSSLDCDDVRRAAQYGQYFASESNAQKVRIKTSYDKIQLNKHIFSLFAKLNNNRLLIQPLTSIIRTYPTLIMTQI